MNTKQPRLRRWRLGAAVGAALAVVGVITSTPALAAGLTRVADESPARLVQSTGNLYWTSNFINEFGPSSSAVYRTGKTDTPGKETVLYSESRNDSFAFGDLAYANVNGAFFGYFAANYTTAGVTQIKRVPLPGGAAVVVANVANPIGGRDLVTDGSFLYWADNAGLRRMALGGGTITTLASSSTLLRVGVDGNFVYYSDGNRINIVPKGGGTITTLAVASARVSSLFVQAASTGTAVYWGDDLGTVQSRSAGGVFSTYQSAGTTRAVASVSFDGTRVLWSDFLKSTGNSYATRKFQGGTTTTVSSGGVGGTDVQGDAGAMFWGDVSGVKKFTH